MPVDFNRKLDELRKSKMADEKPKAPTGADIMAAIESHRAESRANDAAILKALESIMAKQAEQDATMAAIRNTVNQPVQAGATRASTGASVPAATGAEWWYGTGSKATIRLGRDKGKALDTVADLSWWRKVCAENCENPERSKWRDKNLDELAEIDREIARRAAGPGAQAAPDPSDSWGAMQQSPPDDEPLF